MRKGAKSEKTVAKVVDINYLQLLWLESGHDSLLLYVVFFFCCSLSRCAGITTTPGDGTRR